MPKAKSVSKPTEKELQERAELEAVQEAAAAQRGGKELEPLKESAALNKLLLKNARQSLEVISQKTGIPVGEVSERLTNLLNNPGWRDDLMEEKLLLAEIAMLLDDVRERMQRDFVDDEAWAQMVRMQIQIIRTMLEQLEKRRKAINGELALVTRMQADIFAAAIRLAKERAAFELEKMYPELDAQVIHTVFEEALPGAIEYVESRIDE